MVNFHRERAPAHDCNKLLRCTSFVCVLLLLLHFSVYICELDFMCPRCAQDGLIIHIRIYGLENYIPYKLQRYGTVAASVDCSWLQLTAFSITKFVFIYYFHYWHHYYHVIIVVIVIANRHNRQLNVHDAIAGG